MKVGTDTEFGYGSPNASSICARVPPAPFVMAGRSTDSGETRVFPRTRF